MKALRLAIMMFLAFGFVIPWLFSIGEVGYYAEWRNGEALVSAGSHPAILVWAAIAVVLFVVLRRLSANEVTAGVPGLWRRFAAFLIDFWFSILTLSIADLLPLWLESMRTGHFAWHFQRGYAVLADEIFGLPFVLLSMGLIFLYFVIPLTKGKQTVGCFIMRLKVTPPFGDRGAFTFREAVRRTWYEFRGVCWPFWVKDGRDTQGRTWYDRETNSTVVLVDYQ